MGARASLDTNTNPSTLENRSESPFDASPWQCVSWGGVVIRDSFHVGPGYRGKNQCGFVLQAHAARGDGGRCNGKPIGSRVGNTLLATCGLKAQCGLISSVRAGTPPLSSASLISPTDAVRLTATRSRAGADVTLTSPAGFFYQGEDRPALSRGTRSDSGSSVAGAGCTITVTITAPAASVGAFPPARVLAFGS